MKWSGVAVRAFGRAGETVGLRRPSSRSSAHGSYSSGFSSGFSEGGFNTGFSSGFARAYNDGVITVRAKARGYTPEELVGGINQGAREIRILAQDVTFEGGVKAGDKVIIHGRTLNVDSVDASTGRGNELVFFLVRASG